MTGFFNHFPEIADKLHKAESTIVSQTVKFIAGYYTSTAPHATGYMASSAYIRTKTESTYGQGGMEPPKGVTPLSEVDAPPDDLTGYVAVAAPYAQFPEFGTRYQPPQPAFLPAVDAGRASMDTKLSHIEDYLR